MLNSKTITIIVGLPGSGKTILGKAMSQGGVFLDDVDKHGGLEAIIRTVAQKVANIVIADPHLCLRAAQEYAKAKLQELAPDYEIIWDFFENDVVACENNIQHRISQGDERAVFALLRHYAKQYHIPAGVKPRKIWRKQC